MGLGAGFGNGNLFPFPFPNPAPIPENVKILQKYEILRKFRLSRISRKKIFLSVPKHFDLAGQNA